jgi:hypothetical protein
MAATQGEGMGRIRVSIEMTSIYSECVRERERVYAATSQFDPFWGILLIVPLNELLERQSIQGNCITIYIFKFLHLGHKAHETSRQFPLRNRDRKNNKIK